MYYESTEDLPINNWRHINENSDLTYLRIDKKKGSESEDIKAWPIVLDSYYKEFGINEDYEILIEIKTELAMIQNDFAISGEMFLLNRIRHLKQEIQDMIDKPVDGDLMSAINTISKWQGFRLNQKEVSTNEFMYLLRDFRKEAQQIKAKQNNN
jgi:hypothetical protein